VQSIFRLKNLLNPFKYGLLSWQYFSHKVLRWTFAPVSVFLVTLLNVVIVFNTGLWHQGVYVILFYLQSLCYLLALLGFYFENKKVRIKVLFVPYYFVMINYASVRGMFRYFKGQQSVNWEKAKRA
jgi:hypothetical protein